MSDATALRLKTIPILHTQRSRSGNVGLEVATPFGVGKHYLFDIELIQRLFPNWYCWKQFSRFTSALLYAGSGGLPHSEAG